MLQSCFKNQAGLVFTRKSPRICRANHIITAIIYAAVTTAVSSYDCSLNSTLNPLCFSITSLRSQIKNNYETHRSVSRQLFDNYPDQNLSKGCFDNYPD